MASEVESSIDREQKVLELTIQSKARRSLSRDKAKEYEQTVVIIFVGPQDPDVVTQSVVLPLRPVEYRSHHTIWTIPDDAETAIVGLRYQFMEKGKASEKLGRRAMKIVKVVHLNQSDIVTTSS